jgi:protein-S-isoprenylcysteine O-methyltransferase
MDGSHANGQWAPDLNIDSKQSFSVLPKGPDHLPRAFYPGGDRSLSGVALRAFCLGAGAVFGFMMAALLVFNGSQMWGPFLFLGTLGVFHFLEFWITAEYNTSGAFISSFLLTNGSRYRQAHTFAFTEAVITPYLFPGWHARLNQPYLIALGILMIVVGQVVRSLAMAQAGTNFNHQVQSQKSEGHVLVTSGIYAYFRHPSYFGFFWWALGTQLCLGNTVSFAAYALILWYFFKTRITRMLHPFSNGSKLMAFLDEEKHLIDFFGEDYKVYRTRTRVWIPFI